MNPHNIDTDPFRFTRLLLPFFRFVLLIVFVVVVVFILVFILFFISMNFISYCEFVAVVLLKLHTAFVKEARVKKMKAISNVIETKSRTATASNKNKYYLCNKNHIVCSLFLLALMCRVRAPHEKVTKKK